MNPRESRSGWSIWPKEHGTYGQLGLPLATALATGDPGWAGICLAAGAIALFVSHESLLILLGARGSRNRRERGGQAFGAGAAWLLIALAGGVGGLVLGGDGVFRAALVPFALVVMMTPLVFRRQEKSLPGEIIAAATLSSAGLPVAAAGGVQPATALATWSVWLVVFSASTAAVRWIISSHKGRRNRASLVIATIATVAVAGLAPRSTVLLSAVPMLLASWALIARPPHPTGIKRVGWTLLACGALTAVILVWLVRAGGDPVSVQ